VVTWSCNGFDSIAEEGIETGTFAFYDPSTGVLVAIVALHGNGDFTCLGGPSCFPPPLCNSPQSLTCSADASADGVTDAGTVEAGGG
jgi:hypothetical protein